jgi:hypothetical protein
MDNDVWKYDDLRQWFNVYHVDGPPEKMPSPSETGYMLKIVKN